MCTKRILEKGRANRLKFMSDCLALVINLGLVPNYIVLVLGIEGGGPHHMQDHHQHGLRISCDLDIEYSSNVQLRLKFCSSSYLC